MVATRLYMLHEDINNELSITDKQIASIRYTTKSKLLKGESKESKTKLIEKLTRKRDQAISYTLPKETKSIKLKLESDESSDD
ncbi:hypothetical protein ILUMI_19132 [Ignelater luminosus]|uniref:Uncharacterized protein n=1 Tax=Ignelater luminosus TaxID=2038154 RepID=A0A8K0G5V8_IGNLU|nr:hypothetical protein ILUMI_19132 [Ignelater luminosus]